MSTERPARGRGTRATSRARGGLAHGTAYGRRVDAGGILRAARVLLPAIARTGVVLATSSDALIAPFRAFVVWDCLTVVGDRRGLAVGADAGPGEIGLKEWSQSQNVYDSVGESYGVAGVGDDGGGVGLLETEERARGFLVAAPRVYSVSDLNSDAEVVFPSRRTSRAQRHTGRDNGLGRGEADDGEKQREGSEGTHDALKSSGTN